MYYINCFFIYSFLGFLIECLYSFIKKDKVGSGILYGPWTPIYGVGSIIILLLSKFLFQMLQVHPMLEVGIVFLTIMVILTFLEWITGHLIEKIFHVVFWNYKDFKYHIGKYIALEITLIWGIGALLVIYVITPFLNQFITRIPSILTSILLILFIIDTLVVFIKRKVHR